MTLNVIDPFLVSTGPENSHQILEEDFEVKTGKSSIHPRALKEKKRLEVKHFVETFKDRNNEIEIQMCASRIFSFFVTDMLFLVIILLTCSLSIANRTSIKQSLGRPFNTNPFMQKLK
jgi:hypothetical protein